MRQILILTIGLFISLTAFSQAASVSPSRLYFDVSPGEYKSQKLQVTNNSKTTESFQISFADFNSPGKDGKTRIDSAGSDHGCADWLTASPSFFELAPGETKSVEILLQVPNIPEANSVRWAVTAVKLARENKGIDKDENVKSAMQIVQTFQFIIHIFQTPPSVTYKSAKINSFEKAEGEIDASDSTQTEAPVVLKMEIENTGDAIIDCAPYIDLINLDDGSERRVKQKGFSVLPGGVRNIYFKLPADLPKGKYSVLGIVDFGSDDELAGIEITIEL